jgi:type III secretory pathway component EscV
MPALSPKLIAILATAALIAGLGLWVAFEREHVAALTAQVSNLTTQLAGAVSVNHQDQTVIDAMQKTLAQWQAAATAAAAQEDEAKTALAQQLQAHAAVETKAIQLEQQDHAIPKCQDLLNVNLGVFCPNTVAGLRMRSAASGLQGPPRENPGPGPAAAGPSPVR